MGLAGQAVWTQPSLSSPIDADPLNHGTRRGRGAGELGLIKDQLKTEYITPIDRKLTLLPNRQGASCSACVHNPPNAIREKKPVKSALLIRSKFSLAA